MPRRPMLGKSTGALLGDLSLAAVMEYLPREHVKRAIVETGCESGRDHMEFP